MYYLSPASFFPPVSEANKDGILAIGGDLTWHDLQLAYKVVFIGLKIMNPLFGGHPIPRILMN
jgi:leucyl/phenylalanyl-tRNA--protein transferase